jgi:hypothetical protein
MVASANVIRGMADAVLWSGGDLLNS